MAINATAVWRVRAGGAASNGGGYDASISGAGTDYTDQDAAQASWTNLATTGVTATVTSASATFTSAMVGNCIRIASGTNFTAGYYFVVAFTNSTTVVLDRAPTTGAGVSGVGALGGAFPNLNQLANGGAGAQPTITTPLAPGHTIYARGAGTQNPSVVDYAQDSYLQFPAGDTTSGLIRLIGYNGRPMFTSDYPDMVLYLVEFWTVANIKITATGDGGNPFIFGANGVSLNSCVFDEAGFDSPAIVGCANAVGCWFMNTGGTSTGSQSAITVHDHNALCMGNLFDGWRGVSIEVGDAKEATLVNNIVANCHVTGSGAILVSNTTTYRRLRILGNTICNAAADGIKFAASAGIHGTAILNNIIANCGGYGINCSVNSAALNNRLFEVAPDYNCLYSNGTAAYNNMSAGPHDVTLDPQFTNAPGGDYSVGTNMRAIGFPSTFAA
jgi:hypothetical protein